eukprot:3844737-Rhodomonas_salina.4
MATAIKECWPTCTHLLCTYHLGQNIIKNVRPLFRGKGSNKRFHKFLREWWKVCKCTEARGQTKFDLQWKGRDVIDKEYGLDANVAKAYTAAVNQLTRLYDKRHQWAARWTWAVFTAGRGCHSTQRQEAVHSSLKQWLLRPGITLLALAKQIVSYRDNIASKSAEKSVRQHLKNEKRDIPLILKPYEDKVSAVCMDLMLLQFCDQDGQRIGPLNPGYNWDGVEQSTDEGWKLSTREYVADEEGKDSKEENGDEESNDSENSEQCAEKELAALITKFYNIDFGLPGVSGAKLHN